MSNLPLQPLVWSSQNHATSAFHDYLIEWDQDARKNSKAKYVVKYGEIKSDISFNVATGFATIDDAKEWAWNHYNEKMQPYVKPSPTWIDASKQLPQVDVDTQFICAYDSALEPYVRVATFSVEMNDFGVHSDVLAWMPIPDFKESDCDYQER